MLVEHAQLAKELDSVKQYTTRTQQNLASLMQKYATQSGQEVEDIDNLKDIVAIPSLLVQMIQQNLLPQATKLVLKFEQKFGGTN